MFKFKFFIILVINFFLSPYSLAEKIPLSIASGNVTGVYYPTAGAFCRIINNNSQLIYCSALVSEGSVHTVKFLKKNPKNFALIQSDVAEDSYDAKNLFTSDNKFQTLRKVFVTANELFTLVVRENSAIYNIDDFKGKKLSFGQKGNGTVSIINEIGKLKKWPDNFTKIVEINSANIAESLCKGDIDVIAFTVSHPNGLVQEALNQCKTRIIPLKENEIKNLISNNKHYKKSFIPNKYYKTAQEIPTIAVESAIYTTSKLDEQIVYDFTKLIFLNLTDIRSLHPVLHNLTFENMIIAPSSIPFHSGAKKYYREKGWIK